GVLASGRLSFHVVGVGSCGSGLAREYSARARDVRGQDRSHRTCRSRPGKLSGDIYMSLRTLIHPALAASLLLFALADGAAEVIRYGYLELNKDARYDERKAFFRTLSRPFVPPYAGAEVALREARFVGQALGVSFDLARARGADAPALVAELDKLHAEGVRYFLIDAPGKVVA